MLLSQDEARFPMVPTLTATLGVKGHRPVVGTWDCKHLLYVFAVVNLVTAAVHANLVDSPKGATKKTGKSKTRRLQEAFAAHLRHVGRMNGAAPLQIEAPLPNLLFERQLPGPRAHAVYAFSQRFWSVSCTTRHFCRCAASSVRSARRWSALSKVRWKSSMRPVIDSATS